MEQDAMLTDIQDISDFVCIEKWFSILPNMKRYLIKYLFCSPQVYYELNDLNGSMLLLGAAIIFLNK